MVRRIGLFWGLAADSRGRFRLAKLCTPIVAVPEIKRIVIRLIGSECQGWNRKISVKMTNEAIAKMTVFPNSAVNIVWNSVRVHVKMMARRADPPATLRPDEGVVSS